MFGMNESFFIVIGLIFYSIVLWLLFMEVYYKTVNDCYEYCGGEDFEESISKDRCRKEVVEAYRSGFINACNSINIQQYQSTDTQKCLKYKELLISTQEKAEENNKKIKAQKKGMKKLQRKYQKLRDENECLKKQLCKGD